MKLVSIAKDKFPEYYTDIIFDGYKWDPQFGDNSTISDQVLVITADEHRHLQEITEALTAETKQAEELINQNPNMTKGLALPPLIRKEIKKMTNYHPEDHIRLMRFDFHPTVEDTWALSEVNSDVPGGFAESSLLPKIASEYLNNSDYHYVDFSDSLIAAILTKVKPKGTVMLVHCTSYSDDRQVMQFIGDKLTGLGFRCLYGAADHLVFKDDKAFSILGGNTGEIDLIIRFTPVEWFPGIKPQNWKGYFSATTPSCNHPIGIFLQSKRFPLIIRKFKKLGVDFPYWKSLLPKTKAVSLFRNKTFIYKPIWGRVGEGITISEACPAEEYRKTMKDVRKHPRKYVAQRKFISKALVSEAGESFHICLGCFSIEGKAAGYYARLSRLPRIDSNAIDLPVLIERDE